MLEKERSKRILEKPDMDKLKSIAQEVGTKVESIEGIVLDHFYGFKTPPIFVYFINPAYRKSCKLNCQSCPVLLETARFRPVSGIRSSAMEKTCTTENDHVELYIKEMKEGKGKTLDALDELAALCFLYSKTLTLEDAKKRFERRVLENARSLGLV